MVICRKRGKPVSESGEWKQKYRGDSLIEMEAEEKRWRLLEQVLRRLVGRLCAAGMGVNPQLDDELVALAAANRRNADPDELGRLAESLTKTVVALDAVSPVPTISFPADTHTRLAIKSLLERLPAGAGGSTIASALIAELATAKNDAALAGIVKRTGDLIHEHSERLARGAPAVRGGPRRSHQASRGNGRLFVQCESCQPQPL